MISPGDIFFFLIGFLLPFLFYRQYLKENLKKIEFRKNKEEYERQKKLAALSGRSFDIKQEYEASE